MRVILEAVRDLRARPGRSILTAISLFVAVVAIVGIYTVGAVVRGVFIASAEQLDGRAITLQTRMDYGLLTPERLGLVLGTLQKQVNASGGAFALVHEVVAEVGSQPQQISLVAGDLRQVRRMPILSGQWLPPDDRIYPGGLVVNQSAARHYGGVGTRLTVDLGPTVRPYAQRIIGVVADGKAAPQLYQSMTAALAMQPAVLPVTDMPNLLVHYDAAGESAIRSKIREVGTQLGADPSQIEILRADTVAGLLENLRVTQTAFLGIAAVTLIVAILGLLNIGLATVRERSRELTIRRAVGATRSRVFSLVLAGNVVVGAVTALAAIGLAYLAVVLVVPRLFDPASALDAPAFPWAAAAAGLIAALAASVVGGLLPAVTAARVDMADILRE